MKLVNTVTIRLPEDLKERIQKLAESRFISPADVMREGLRKLVDEAEAQEKAKLEEKEVAA